MMELTRREFRKGGEMRGRERTMGGGVTEMGGVQGDEGRRKGRER